ncbi:MAG: plasmid mobilization relaxosome protein MobC [Clostridia bacterium]|nr:plasmid mobilization relaxosome protein MobC [Clostridia bacterium]
MSKNRTERLQLRLSSEEKEAIAQKAADANMSIADYIVALSANQKIIDAKIIAQLILEIRRIGVNVNQVAAVANYQKFANKEMLSKVNDGQNQIIDLLMKILSEVYDTEKHDIRSLENQMAKLTEAIEGMMKSGNSQSN